MSRAPSLSLPASRGISVRAASLRLRVTDRQVYKMLALGRLVSVAEVGRSIKVEPESVERLALELGVPAPEAEGVAR